LAVTAVLAIYAQLPPKHFVPAHPPQIAFVAPYIPPVSGIPVSAEYAIQVEHPPSSGGSGTLHTSTLVARDSSGRIRHELHDSVPASFTKEPPLQGVVLLDSVARLTHCLDPVLRTDDRRWYHPSQSHPFDSGASGGEDLGTRNIDGFEVIGVRRSWTLAPRLGAPGPRPQVVDETWYSSELQMVVYEQQTNSAGSTVTITLAHLDRGEPLAELFRVPRGYHPLSPPSHASLDRTPPYPADYNPYIY
jgi:hypothetical protein